MQALMDLRAALLDDKTLDLEPDNLITFVESGQVLTYPSGTDENKNFSTDYDAVIYILKTAIDVRYICWVIGEWMNVNQPDRDPETSISYDVDILAHDKVSFEFILKMSECVLVTENVDLGNGKFGTGFSSEFGRALAPVHGVVIANAPGGPTDTDNLISDDE